ncbi:MAG: tetratricopeptide repeat protein [Proteobacteria bacterium]|nr:tetratricopeptide repeat protein [Pseudomonadota bacterium]
MFRGFFAVCLMLFLGLKASASAVKLDIQFVGEAVHLELAGHEQWNYDLKRTTEKNKVFIDLQVPRLDQSSVDKLEKFSAPFVKSVQVLRQNVDGQDVVRFEITDSEIESFDYLTDQPSRLIVDLFKSQPSPTAKTAQNPKTTEKTKSANTVAPKQKEAKARNPASDTLVINQDSGNASADVKPRAGVFDGADPNFDRFAIKDFEVKEEAVLASRENVYLEFPILKQSNDILSKMLSRPPVYIVEPKDTDENKQARLLVQLFSNKRYNVFLKTLNWFLEKYPQSEYDELVRFMWADAHFAQWREGSNVSDYDLAMIRYRQAMERYPQSALAERTLMLMSFSTLERGDYLATLRQFQAHIRNRPTSPNRDLSRLGIAESFLKIKRFDDAINQLNEIEKDGQRQYAVQAAYLKGDVYFEKKDYPNAIKEYAAAQSKFPDTGNEFPNAVYNQAAALFWTGEHRKSLELYSQFLQRFPSHPYSGYAMTRIGELLEILGADKTRVVGAYLEAYFRYGNEPSARVARMRLLSERMPQMKEKELKNAIQEIEAIVKEDKELLKLEQFATILVSDGLSKRKEYEDSINRLIKYYQANPTSADTQLLSSRIVRNINAQISDEVQKGRFLEALKIHNKYTDSWLKSSQRIDTKVNLAKAFELAGTPSRAEEIYKATLNEIYALKGSPEERQKRILEKIPSTDDLNLRLASVTFGQGKFPQAFDYLKQIQKPDSLSEVDQIERVKLTSSLLQRRGDLRSATRYLSELLREWKGIPELVADSYLQLAQLEVQLGDQAGAVKSLEKISTLQKDSNGKVPAEVHAKSLEMLGDLKFKSGQEEDGIKAYENLLSQYESEKPLSSIRYKVGQYYFKKGEIQKAADVWDKLKSNKSQFWYKLAQEQLKSSEWKNDYKKYIQRIPAMEGTQ